MQSLAALEEDRAGVCVGVGGMWKSTEPGDRRLDFGSNAVTADETLHRSPALPGPLFPHLQKERLQGYLYYLQHQHYL